MNFWQKTIQRLGLAPKPQLTPQKPQKRAYQAAVPNRLTSDWVTAPTSERTERRQWLQSMRARSRDLSRNDDYVKQFLRMCRSNIVGRGIKLQSQARTKRGDKTDQILNQAVEAAFARWGKKANCTTSCRLSWVDAQRRFVTTLARDGEVLIRLNYDKKNPFGFAIQFLDVGWLDETYNGTNASNNNRIIMSVEVDEYEKPVAYWLRPPTDKYTDPGAMRAQYQRVRIPADEIIHEFLPDDSEDDTVTRGIPWTHAAALKIKILDGYEEAELVAARVGACKMGFITPPKTEEFEGDDLSGETAQIIDEAEPGTFSVLPPDHTISEWNPDHPNANYPAFIKAALRSIASGLGVSYNSLANDLEGVNYSSIRAGLLEERDVWRALQQFTVEHFCEPIFERWLQSAWLNSQLQIDLSDLSRVQAKFQPRGWVWIDPYKDTNASILAIDNHLATRSDILAEQGEDFEEVIKRLAEEKRQLQEAGIWQEPQENPQGKRDLFTQSLQQSMVE